MGAMKAIYTDIQELQENAVTGDEDSFISYIEATGWLSPSENEIRASKASKMIAHMAPGEKAAALLVLKTVGVDMPAIDFPMASAGVTLGEHASAA